MSTEMSTAFYYKTHSWVLSVARFPLIVDKYVINQNIPRLYDVKAQ